MSETPAPLCANCVHWEHPWDAFYGSRKVPSEQHPRWGSCKKIDMPGFGSDNVGEDVVAFVTDGSDYTADLHTREDFGCVLWAAPLTSEDE